MLASVVGRSRSGSSGTIHSLSSATPDKNRFLCGWPSIDRFADTLHGGPSFRSCLRCSAALCRQAVTYFASISSGSLVITTGSAILYFRFRFWLHARNRLLYLVIPMKGSEGK